jgi:hypothetical protein
MIKYEYRNPFLRQKSPGGPQGFFLSIYTSGA